VGGGVRIKAAAIKPARDDLVAVDNHGTHRYLSKSCGTGRLFQSGLHEEDILVVGGHAAVRSGPVKEQPGRPGHARSLLSGQGGVNARQPEPSTPDGLPSVAVTSLRDRLRQQLRARVQGGLKPQATAHAQLTHELAEAGDQARALTQRVAALEGRQSRLMADATLMSRPFHSQMTVDQAWRRHPGAPAVFARFHLPSCDGCAVRFDETVEEAAAAYGLNLSTLMTALGALLDSSKDRDPNTEL
jgi:hypothetical protein